MRRELDRLARQVADMSVEVADVAAAARVVDGRPKTAKSKKTSGSKSKHKHKHDGVTHGEVGS